MLIVGIGGTLRPGSNSEAALREVLHAAARRGFDTEVFASQRLQLPPYRPKESDRTPAAAELVEAMREASGVVISSPAYHGTISGLVKNALDYAEDLADDPGRTYFDGMPVGCIAVAHGWQSAVNTLRTLREVVHALRGWPTPYGAAINASERVFHAGACVHKGVRDELDRVADQVASFALGRPAAAAPTVGELINVSVGIDKR